MLRIRGTGPAAGLVLILTAFVVVWAGAPLEAGAEVGGFESSWEIKGSARQLEFGPTRTLRTVRHTGTITFRSATGLVGTVLTSCIGLNDSAQSDIGRCTWVTADGERLYSELSGSLPPGLSNGAVTGTFVGGTGRFAGVTGSYTLDWVARPVPEKDAFSAQSVRMSGSWRTP